jgi:hypothetical protein
MAADPVFSSVDENARFLVKESVRMAEAAAKAVVLWTAIGDMVLVGWRKERGFFCLRGFALLIPFRYLRGGRRRGVCDVVVAVVVWIEEPLCRPHPFYVRAGLVWGGCKQHQRGRQMRAVTTAASVEGGVRGREAGKNEKANGF